MDVGNFIDEFQRLWSSGGILMWPLLLIAVFLYWNIFELFSRFSQMELHKPLSEILIKHSGGHAKTQFAGTNIGAAKIELLLYFDARLKFLSTLAGVSPLLGLLGTVMGMLGTFSVMNTGDVQKIDLMAGGISEALITTQMGLIIAIPAMLMIVSLNVKQDQLKTLFEKMEMDCNRLNMAKKGGS